MTSNSDKLRSLILAALMVFSVFAGTVALTGSAAAVGGNTSGAPTAQKATHYVGNSGPVLEVTFDETVAINGTVGTNITITDESGNAVVDGATVTAGDLQDGQLLYDTGSVVSDVDTVTIENIDDQNGNAATVTRNVKFAPSSANVSANTDGNEYEVYRGSNLAIYNENNLEQVFEIEGDDISYDETKGSGNNSAVYVWDTDDRELGDYEITNGGNTVNVTIQDLGLTVEPDETSFDDDENVTATVDMSDINRDVSVRLLDSSDDTLAYVNESTNSSGMLTADFGEQDVDNYTLEVEDTATGVTATSDEFEVVDAGDESADFGSNVYSNQRGDLVNISVEMSNTDEATLQIGDVDSSGYGIIAQITDDDEDGVAYVEFNSFTAGNQSATTISAGDDDTNIDDVSYEANSFDDNRPTGSDILDDTDYDMYVVSGTENGVDSDNADARATLSLSEASIDNLQLWTSPEDSLSDLRDADAEDIPAYAQAGNLTQTGVVAEGDAVVVQVEASGLEGALENGDTTELYNSTSALGNLFDLTFEGEDIPNQGEASTNVANLSTDNYSVLYDGANDQHFVVIDSTALVDQFPEHSDGDEYTANFTVNESGTDLVDDDVSLTSNFDIEDPEINLDTNADEEIVLEAAAGQEVTGDTNLAPGTEVEVSLDSDTSGDPFLKSPEGTVQADGTFSAVADFSDNNAGSEFTAQASVGGTDSDEYDGRLVESTGTPVTDTPEPGTDTGTAAPGTDTATPMDTDTATPMDTDTDTATATETSTEAGTGAEETATGGSGPGFTAALALIALVAAALLAVRRDN
ncbi:BGTF surface domain-containing protein [Haloarcula onubensis]|uniref:Surface glycoprotein n=1 Tax=Haloarcula onubensis TaxID=2950539 RepID=A0ABU2FQ77_9EURY|nr:BGTF surface domain-containing protein [Halomicroarcula sp. S3CR25-11]MDS0282918.1 surface glycoprotein [Halomicroarcula sp. S3CR25-11]